MATRGELKTLAKARLQTTRVLISAKEWDMAAYLMGYTLENTLKAATCHALKVDQYPDYRSHRNEKIGGYFMTHNFDQLLLVSGLSDIFSVDGIVEAFDHWSVFTQEYSGEWTAMRYISGKFDEAKVRELYLHLYEDPDSILKTVIRKHRW